MLCVKTTRDMTAKLQDGYKKSMQCMWILNINDAWKKKFGQRLGNWKFFIFNRSSIDRLLIETGRFKQKNLIAISIGRETGLIDQKSGKIKFLKNRAILCRNSS